MSFRNGFLIGLSLVSASFSIGTASAGAIAVSNPSFEIYPAGGLNHPFPGNGGFSEAPIPGWVNFQTPGLTGQYAPGNIPGAEYDYLPDGITFAYSNDGTISQTVGATVQVGVVYTLSVEIGKRKDCCGVYGTADLLVNGTPYAATGTVATAGGWAQWTAIYTGLLADVGDAITIELKSTGAQGDFDGVSLSDDTAGDPPSVPEPGSVLLMCTGFASVVLLVRRRVHVSR